MQSHILYRLNSNWNMSTYKGKTSEHSFTRRSDSSSHERRSLCGPLVYYLVVVRLRLYFEKCLKRVFPGWEMSPGDNRCSLRLLQGKIYLKYFILLTCFQVSCCLNGHLCQFNVTRNVIFLHNARLCRYVNYIQAVEGLLLQLRVCDGRSLSYFVRRRPLTHFPEIDRSFNLKIPVGGNETKK